MIATTTDCEIAAVVSVAVSVVLYWRTVKYALTVVLAVEANVSSDAVPSAVGVAYVPTKAVEDFCTGSVTVTTQVANCDESC